MNELVGKDLEWFWDEKIWNGTDQIRTEMEWCGKNQRAQDQKWN